MRDSDKKRKYCVKCKDNFYNHRGGGKTCWHLPDSKVVWKKVVGLWWKPPWRQKAERVLDCQHIKGYVMIPPDVER